jgi:hypothetical protein
MESLRKHVTFTTANADTKTQIYWCLTQLVWYTEWSEQSMLPREQAVSVLFIGAKDKKPQNLINVLPLYPTKEILDLHGPTLLPWW